MKPSEPAGAPIGALTVASALRETPLRDARLVAGRVGLERRIDSVTVLDPGDLDALRPATLVLSNADPLSGLDVRRLIARFADAGVSAVGVNPDGVWRAAREDLVAACDARGLPLLVLAAGRVEALVNPVLEAIAERQSERLRRIGELHDALTRAALGNEPMPAITATVARVLGVPVAVLDEHGGLVTGTGRGSLWSPHALAAETTATPGAGTVEADGTRYLLAPISTVGRRYGALCAAGPVEDEAFARAALAQAAVVCGMQLVGRQRVEAVHRKFERQLLEDLADGNLSPDEARERAERLRWPPDVPYLVMLVARRPRRPRGPLEVGGFTLDDRSSDAFARALAGGGLAARPFPRRQGLGVIVHLARGEDRRRPAEAVRRRLASVRGVPWAASDLAIGVSEARGEVTDVPGALREAVLALMTSRRLRAGNISVEHFGDLGAVRLLASIPDVELAAMAREALGPLGDPGIPGGKDLLATLAALSAHNMRLADAAGDLYFHYNTVRHRLARLRLILGSRMADPDGRLSLSLALAAVRIVAVERPDLALGTGDAPLSAEPSSAQPRFRRAPSESPRERSRR
jgi:PucR family transcriptional regulator, purine catabolism regulatory protein